MVAFLGSRTFSIAQLLQLVVFARFCINASIANCVNNNDFVVTVGEEEKDCKGYLGKYNLKIWKQKCKETVETSLLGQIVVEDACPALCKPSECCSYNTEFLAIVKKGELNCKRLFGKKQKVSKEKLESSCDRTVKVKNGGEVVVKNECVGFCNPGCKKAVKCNDKSLRQSFTLKRGEGPFTCESYLGKKDNKKKFCNRKVMFGEDKVKQKLQSICPHLCKSMCTF